MPKVKGAEPARKSNSTLKKAGNSSRAEPAGEKSRTRKLKEIAGVKVPKDMRELAAAAQKLAENPLVREVVTAGIMAAMAAMAEAQQESRERKAQRAAGGPVGAEGERKAGAKSTAKVIAAAAAGAMSKRIVSEVKTRGPELLAKLEGVGKSAGAIASRDTGDEDETDRGDGNGGDSERDGVADRR